MLLTVCLLTVLLAGGAVWWRWSWRLWCQRLTEEQVGRDRDRFTAATEYALLQNRAGLLRGVLEQHRDGLASERTDLDFVLWELTVEEGDEVE